MAQDMPMRLLDLWPALLLDDVIETPAAILREFGSAEDASPSRAIGSRDRALLGCRQSILGDHLEAFATCPRCGADVEADLSCASLMATDPADERPWTVRLDRYRIRLRAVDVAGAALAASATTIDDARRRLLERAVVEVERGGQPVPLGEVPPSVDAQIAAALADRDPGAELVLAFACPACASTWTDVLDVARIVCGELAASAREVMTAVDRLARAYGWTESEILALPPARRGAYLAMAEV